MSASELLDFCSNCLSSIVEDDDAAEFGRYKIERRLGEGSAGHVYLAVDPALGRRVAIKVLSDHVASQEELLQRFRREAQTLAALSHENIVPIYAFEQAESHWLLVMEYLGGQSLAERMQHAAPLPIEQILNYTRQIALGLAAAHERQIIHRDLKPANLLIDGSRLKIADFGLAKNEIRATAHRTGKSDPLTQTGLVVGTVPYMSPEQARGRPVDSRTDLFSLGVVLYEMVAGHRPFRGATTFTLMTSILTDQPPSLRTLRPELPREFEQIVECCLQKNRSKRRITASEIAQRIERLERPKKRANVVGSLTRRLKRVGRLFSGSQRIVETEPASSRPILGVVPPWHDRHPDLDFIAFGIADGLGLRLNVGSLLDVRSGNCVQAIQSQPAQALESARLLNFEWLLTGALSGSIDRLDLSLELVETSQNRRAWSKQLQCSAAELRPRLEEIAEAVEATVLGHPSTQSDRPSPPCPEAELLVLKGLHNFRKLTPESLQQAAKLFERACEIDDESARAHGWLALCKLQLGRASERQLIRFHALRAVELAPESGELQCILGNVLWLMEWDFGAAEIAFRRALELAPNHPLTPHGYSLLLSSLGRHEKALELAKRAVELDPLNPIASLDLGRRLLLAGRFHEAEAPMLETLQLHPDFDLAHSFLGQVYLYQGRSDAAVELFERGARHSLWQAGLLGAAYAASGRTAEAERVLVELGEQRRPLDTQSAMVLTALGDHESALQALEAALEVRDEQLLWAGVEPVFEPLRDQRRFRRLLRSIGLPRSLWGIRSSAHRAPPPEPLTDDQPLHQ